MEHKPVEVLPQELIDDVVSLFEGVELHGLVQSPQSLGEGDTMVNVQSNEDALEVEVEVETRREALALFLNASHPLDNQVHCLTQ